MSKIWDRWSEPVITLACFLLAAAIMFVVAYEPAHTLSFWTGGRPMLEVLAWVAVLAAVAVTIAIAISRRFGPEPKQRLTLARTVLWLELFALPLGLIGLGATFTELSDARQVANEEREERYREIVFGRDKEYGESWRALGRLMDMGISVPTPENLTCKAKTGRCYVEGFRAHPREIVRIDGFIGSNIHFGWDLENLIFDNADFRNAQIGGVLRKVTFNHGRFRGAEIVAKVISSDPYFARMYDVHFQGVSLGGVDLSYANDLREVTFDFSDLSGAVLCGRPVDHMFSTHPDYDPVSTGCPLISPKTFALAYYQRHSPPLGMEWFLEPSLMWRCDLDTDDKVYSEESLVRAGCTRTSLLEQSIWPRWPEEPDDD